MSSPIGEFRVVRPGSALATAVLVALFLLCAPQGACAADPLIITGKASWYGSPPHEKKSAHGKATASGRVFDRSHFTAAHRTLPFGTVLRVYNLANSHHVLVAVSDRGPFIRNRQLDVSYRAARILNFVRRGVTEIWAEVVSDEAGAPLAEGSAYYLQFGVRPDMVSSLELQRDIRFRLKLATKALRVSGETVFPYHICAGPWRTFKEAEEVMDEIPPYYSEAQIILGPESGDVLPRLKVPDAAESLQKKHDSHKKKRSIKRVQRK